MYLAAVVKWTGNAACCAPPYNSLFPPTMRTGGDDDDNDGGDDYDNDGNGDDNDDTDSTFHTILCSRQQWGPVVMMAMMMTMVMTMIMIMMTLTLPSKQFFVLPQQANNECYSPGEKFVCALTKNVFQIFTCCPNLHETRLNLAFRLANVFFGPSPSILKWYFFFVLLQTFHFFWICCNVSLL